MIRSIRAVLAVASFAFALPGLAQSYGGFSGGVGTVGPAFGGSFSTGGPVGGVPGSYRAQGIGSPVGGSAASRAPYAGGGSSFGGSGAAGAGSRVFGASGSSFGRVESHGVPTGGGLYPIPPGRAGSGRASAAPPPVLPDRSARSATPAESGARLGAVHP